MKTKYSEQIILMILDDNIPINEKCKKYKICKSTYYNWKKQYQEKIFSDGRKVSLNEVRLLKLKINKLEQIIDVYCKSGCTPHSSLDDKVRAIHILKDVYSIHTLCDAFQILRSTYYHKEKIINNPTATTLNNEIIKEKILIILEESKFRLGVKKVKIKLQELGYNISHTKISRLMKEMNVSYQPAKRNRRSHSTQNQKVNNYSKNKLAQNFNPVIPNHSWVSDTTQVKGNDNTRYYICVVLDLFSRKIIASRVSMSHDTQLVANAFLKAYNDRNKPQNLIFHSDQGSQFTSVMFTQLLETLSITQSLSRKASPHDNAVIESFFSYLKKEELNRNSINDINELIEIMSEYTDFYNNYRPHQSLGYKTPNQIETEYLNKNEIT